MDKNLTTNIFVAGHKGMVGSALCRSLRKDDVSTLFLASRDELDLSDTEKVREFLESNRIGQIYLAAAKVGGIHANSTFPADFIRDNMLVQLAVVDAAYQAGVSKLLFLGSSCIYPRMAKQPISENALMTGPLEPTNEAYAIAKISGIKLCEAYQRQHGADFRSVMPTNLYGPNDNFHPENSHVVPALIRRFHEAKEKKFPSVIVWGSGRPLREFLYVDDMAEACIHIMNITRSDYESVTSSVESHINIGTGIDCSISDLAHSVAKVVGYEGKIVWDSIKPDGTPRKLLNVDKAGSLGWRSSTELAVGLAKTYEWFCGLDEHEKLRCT